MHAPLHFPKLPDWLIYAAVVSAFLVAALSRGERADAPPAPPPPAPGEGAVLAQASAFDDSLKVRAAPAAPSSAGTAFSVGDGVWLSAGHVLDGCRRAALIVAAGQGVEARVAIDRPTDLAILRTEGGAPAMPLALEQPLREGARGFHPGFPQGRPGEATSRVLGRQTLVMRDDGSRQVRTQPVVAWAEVGRTDGLNDLAGLSGAPVLDGAGRVVGITIAEAPRRGRIYTAAPETLRAALTRAKVAPETAALGDPITVENYGRMADALRRNLQVAQVVCLSR